MKNSLKKIVIIGSESTGKTILTSSLSEHYQESIWVEEYARTYLQKLNRPYDYEDLTIIAKKQLTLEEKKIKFANKYLFCDTNLWVIHVWSEHKYKKTSKYILNKLSDRKYDFYLLTYPDLMWEYDPQREHPTKSKYFFDVFRKILTKEQLPYGIVKGKGATRLHNATLLIDDFFR